MSRARHHEKHRAEGGKAVAYAGGDSNVMKEAKEKKTGGAVKRKEGGKVPGFKRGGRLDKFARGGGVGSDKSPFSSAHLKGAHGPASNPSTK